jgi:hypothetical protein
MELHLMSEIGAKKEQIYLSLSLSLSLSLFLSLLSYLSTMWPQGRKVLTRCCHLDTEVCQFRILRQ